MTVSSPAPSATGESAGPPPSSSRSSRRGPVGGSRGWRGGGIAGPGGARTGGFVATTHAALLAVLLVGFGPAACRSFVVSPPAVGGGALLVQAFGGGGNGAAAAAGGAAARGSAECRLAAAGEDETGRAAGGAGVAPGWGSQHAARRRSSQLQGKMLDNPDGDEYVEIRPEDTIRPDDFSDEAMRKLMFNLDPNSDKKGPMYFGDQGMYSREIEHIKYPEEVRFPQCFLAFCLDREDAEGEWKNYVTSGLRKKAHWEHLEWARIAKRTFADDKDREAGILWDRSVLSPSKFRVIGNMLCIRSYTKEGALRLLEEDPYRQAGLFGTVSVYRYPYDMAGEFNWHHSTFPYLALCMDKKDTGKLREEHYDAHIRHYGRTRRCSGLGPIMDSDLAEDDPESKPIGSLMFFNAINDEEARETAEGDPYNQAGIYDSVFIARFNEIDLCGIGNGRANRIDPMRDAMAKVGLDRPIEYPVHEGKLDVYANMKWLQVKAEKKHYQIYMEARLKMYQERDRRIERGRINEGQIFRPGVYVYMGKRTEMEWYDCWPTSIGPDSTAQDSRMSLLENCYPPVDIIDDDLG